MEEIRNEIKLFPETRQYTDITKDIAVSYIVCAQVMILKK